MPEDMPLASVPTRDPGLHGAEEGLIRLATEIGGYSTLSELLQNLPEHLTPLVPEEEPFLDGPDQRLGCQARVQGPVHVRLAPGA